MELKLILESLLFSAQKPLTTAELRDVLVRAAEEPEADETVRAHRGTPPDAIAAALAELAAEHEAAARSYRLVCVAGAWQFVTTADSAPWLRAFFGVRNRPARLSQPALETMAIVAYRQPITRAEIEQIRGVAVDGVMATLRERGLVVEAGRAEVIGKPMLYATTPAFLEYFGLASLDDLPAADELRRIPVQRPESLLTADGDPSLPLEDAPADAAVQRPADAPGADPAPVEATASASGDAPESDPVPAPVDPEAPPAAPPAA